MHQRPISRSPRAPGIVGQYSIQGRTIAMKHTPLASLFGAGLFVILTVPAGAQAVTTEQEAQAIAVEAYIYFYSLVTMDVSRRHFTNLEPGTYAGKGPLKQFNHVPGYTPDM